MSPDPGVATDPAPAYSLLDVVVGVTAAESLDDALAVVAESACRSCCADGAAAAVFGRGRGPGGVSDLDGLAAFGSHFRGTPHERIGHLEALYGATGAPGDLVAQRGSGGGRDAFLGLPVELDGQVVGALYVSGRRQGGFGSADRDLLAAHAVAVAGAVRTARRQQLFRTQQEWLTATAEIGAQLLTHTGEDPLRLIARRASELAGADLVVVSLVTDDRAAVVIEQAYGPNAPDITGRRFPVHETMSGLAIVEERAILADAADGEEHFGRHGNNLQSVIDIGPVMVLPLVGTERVRGSMSISRVRGSAPFSQTDLALAAGFATHASVALELADSRVAEQRVVLLEDRDRIARDLHDHVIQELFAIGLSLQSVAAQLGPDSAASARIGLRVEDLDRTIRRIRTSIFELRGPFAAGHGDGLRQCALEIVGDLTPALGFAPRATFSGPVEHAVDPSLTADVTAVLREGLTNVAKHAHASEAAIDIDLLTGEVVVTVSDDGVGPGSSARSSGVANLSARAERRGGTFEMKPGATGGTLLIWRAPFQ